MPVLISPTKATVVVRLPSSFACAYSPGFDLHVSGTGETEQEARLALIMNLEDLAAELLDHGRRIREGE